VPPRPDVLNGVLRRLGQRVERLSKEAAGAERALAALAGTSPVEASSGKQRRHRLNRGGDRQLSGFSTTSVEERREDELEAR
jgi:transposase